MTLKTKLPAILAAHNLLGGYVVFWSGAEWTKVFAKALILSSPEEYTSVQSIIPIENTKNQVCDCEFIELIEEETGKYRPRHFRDYIMVNGPTIEVGAK